MKKLFLLAAMVFSLLSAKAQILKRSTVDEIKQGRVIVALKDDERLNEI
ncbi:hypothetical protein GCM10011506_15970 [Marivirga lumbricoides]|uniref:Peptidylprolyl isomerase n=1 Tax=Marivirga lumbricoides TaxID=1046115 RepID=A0ABQ1LXF9_9BACT|nr:hypothetical protein GCM10011506_15970 [Marivirga lumbricoides]